MGEYINLYTDGGCRGNGKEINVGAYGCFMEYVVDEEVFAKKEIGGKERNTTNNIMELMGAIEGLKAINRNIRINMYLDSNYVKNGIESWISKWKRNNWRTTNRNPVKNKELWVELDKLVSQFDDIHFNWVKGHADNYGNTIADRICNDLMDELERENKVGNN